MKIKTGGHDRIDPDMTPMIDVTFQLIIFFMLTLNFAADDQSELIKLPDSELAKPPESPWESPITLQLKANSEVIVGGEAVPLKSVSTLLEREKANLVREKKSVGKATIIIRADRNAKTGTVQKLIKECQDKKFEKFVLRAREKDVVVQQGGT